MRFKRAIAVFALLLATCMTLCACSPEMRARNSRYENAVVRYNNTFLLESSDSDFVFEKCDGGYSVKEYVGTNKNVVVPLYHNDVSVVSISEFAFKDKDVNIVYVGGKVKKIENKSFYGCKLTKVVISKLVEEIGDYAFINCNILKTIVVESELKTIKSGVFSGCNHLKYFIVPKSVVSISNNAFDDVPVDFCLKVYSGSYGEEFAKMNNLEYELI